jgi:hypothetical protein
LTLRRAVFDRHILAFDEPLLPQSLADGGNPVGKGPHGKVAEQSLFSDLPCDSILQIDYGNIHVAFRAGANPTGIRAVSFRDLMSTTETSFVCSLAT